MKKINLTKVQQAFLASIKENYTEENSWVLCDKEEMRTAKSLEKKGLLLLNGCGSETRQFEVTLTTEGERYLGLTTRNTMKAHARELDEFLRGIANELSAEMRKKAEKLMHSNQLFL